MLLLLLLLLLRPDVDESLLQLQMSFFLLHLTDDLLAVFVVAVGVAHRVHAQPSRRLCARSRLARVDARVLVAHAMNRQRARALVEFGKVSLGG